MVFAKKILKHRLAQEHFLQRQQTKDLFRRILDNADPRWRFNHSSFFLEFLQGDRDYQCTAWGNPTRNVFGWQKPCYLMSDGYVKTFKELIEETPWERYGTGRDPRCADCMVHCGYEPSAVNDAMSSLGNMLHAARPASRRPSAGPATRSFTRNGNGHSRGNGAVQPNVKLAFREKE